MRDRSFRGGNDEEDRGRREWSRLSEEDMREARRSARPRLSGRKRGDFERQYGSGSGPEGYGGRDDAHTGAFTGSSADFSEPSGRHHDDGPDYGSGGRGFVSRERTRLGRGAADDYGRRDLETGGAGVGEAVSRGNSRSPLFDDEPPSFGMQLQGNFGMDRGGQGFPGASYFGGSDRGRPTTSHYASGHGHMGGDVDRGFAGNSAAGGADRGYSGGFNYGWGGNAYRGGAGHDRFADVPPEMRQQEQTMRGYRGAGPRNYRPSDSALRDLVCERLHDDHDVDASEIDVTVDNAVVRLSGTVADRRMKRLAERVAESVRGIEDVENRLTIGNAGRT